MPEPLPAQPQDPGAPEIQPLVAAFSDEKSATGVTIWYDDTGNEWSSFAESFRDRVRADLGEWTERDESGYVTWSTKAAETGPGAGPDSFVSLHAVRINGDNKAWVLQCVGPKVEGGRLRRRCRLA